MKKSTATKPLPQPPGRKPIKAESVRISIEATGQRVRFVASPRAGRHSRPFPEIEMSHLAAGRLGRALVRKDAEIAGIAGVNPVVADSLTVVILQEADDTLSAAHEASGTQQTRSLIGIARTALRHALSRIETGASHG